MNWDDEGPRDLGLALSYLLQERTVGGGQGLDYYLKLSIPAHSASFTNSLFESLLNYKQWKNLPKVGLWVIAQVSNTKLLYFHEDADPLAVLALKLWFRLA